MKRHLSKWLMFQCIFIIAVVLPTNFFTIDSDKFDQDLSVHSFYCENPANNENSHFTSTSSKRNNVFFQYKWTFLDDIHDSYILHLSESFLFPICYIDYLIKIKKLFFYSKDFSKPIFHPPKTFMV